MMSIGDFPNKQVKMEWNIPDDSLDDHSQEVMEPVKEVGSPESEKTFHKSQSVQCTSEGSEECGTRLFAQGRVLCDTDMHSLSLDSGMVKLSLNKKIDDLRSELSSQIKDLTTRLDEKDAELKKMTEQKIELETKCMEEKERVEELTKEKTDLENKIEALQNEVLELRHKVLSAVNNNDDLEAQIKELKDQKKAEDLNTLQNLGGPGDDQPLLEKLFAAIQGVMVEHSAPPKTGLTPDQLMAIQKASAVKEDYKNGSDKNGHNNHSPSPPTS